MQTTITNPLLGCVPETDVVADLSAPFALESEASRVGLLSEKSPLTALIAAWRGQRVSLSEAVLTASQFADTERVGVAMLIGAGVAGALHHIGASAPATDGEGTIRQAINTLWGELDAALEASPDRPEVKEIAQIIADFITAKAPPWDTPPVVLERRAVREMLVGLLHEAHTTDAYKTAAKVLFSLPAIQQPTDLAFSAPTEVSRTLLFLPYIEQCVSDAEWHLAMSVLPDYRRKLYAPYAAYFVCGHGHSDEDYPHIEDVVQRLCIDRSSDGHGQTDSGQALRRIQTLIRDVHDTTGVMPAPAQGWETVPRPYWRPLQRLLDYAGRKYWYTGIVSAAVPVLRERHEWTRHIWQTATHPALAHAAEDSFLEDVLRAVDEGGGAGDETVGAPAGTAKLRFWEREFRRLFDGGKQTDASRALRLATRCFWTGQLATECGWAASAWELGYPMLSDKFPKPSFAEFQVLEQDYARHCTGADEEPEHRWACALARKILAAYHARRARLAQHRKSKKPATRTLQRAHGLPPSLKAYQGAMDTLVRGKGSPLWYALTSRLRAAGVPPAAFANITGDAFGYLKTQYDQGRLTKKRWRHILLELLPGVSAAFLRQATTENRIQAATDAAEYLVAMQERVSDFAMVIDELDGVLDPSGRAWYATPLRDRARLAQDAVSPRIADETSSILESRIAAIGNAMLLAGALHRLGALHLARQWSAMARLLVNDGFLNSFHLQPEGYPGMVAAVMPDARPEDIVARQELVARALAACMVLTRSDNGTCYRLMSEPVIIHAGAFGRAANVAESEQNLRRAVWRYIM